MGWCVMAADSEQFISETRSGGDLAGVFERDSDTAYFYLYDIRAPKVLDQIHIASGEGLDDLPSTLTVRWNGDNSIVGLFIAGVLWAVFDVGRSAKAGGGFAPDATPHIPIAMSFVERPT
jgi:hypothetical protein